MQRLDENNTSGVPVQAALFAFPASYAQERLWFLDQVEPQSSLYNSALAFRLTGPLDGTALQGALDEVVRRHDALRTTFARRGEQLMQMVSESLPPQYCKADLRGLPPDTREGEAWRHALAAARAPFDLATGPLVRALLLQLDAQEHLFVFTLHHIVADGWSVRVIFEELSAVYTARASGRTSCLLPVAIQYPDFAVWQREELAGGSLERHLEFWTRTLSADAGDLGLPADRIRPPDSTRGASRSFAIDAALHRALAQLGRSEGASLFMTLLAGLDALLHRLTGDTDIAIGAPIASRDQPELERAVGFFANTVVYRTPLADDPSFRVLLRRVREIAAQVYEHHAAPFQHVVAAVRPARDAAHTPLFRVMLALQPALESTLCLPNVRVELLPLETDTAKFDLQLEIQESPEGLRGVIEYAADLFDDDAIERIAVLYETLLRAAVAEPERAISRLPLLSGTERRCMLEEWNDTRSSYPRDAALHDLFDEQALRAPDAVAVEHGAERLTYAALRERSSALAVQLAALGVEPGTPVAIATVRSVEFVIAVLATLRAGGAYLPLDPNYPRERTEFMLADAGARVLLADARAMAHPLHFDGPVLDLHAATHHQLGMAPVGEARRALTAVSGNAPAYVMYTSGSTGRPKGVVVPHRAVTRLVRDTNYVSVDAGDVVAHVSSVSFDAATFEIWGALLNGARLTIIDHDTLLAPEAFATALRARRVSVMFLTAALFNQVATAHPAAFGALKCLMVGGEALDPASVRRVLEAAPPGALLNGYGPTETTTFAATFRIDTVPPNAVRIPIGRPIGNTRTYVLDRHRELAPAGVIGELYIGGDGVAQGYLGRPDLSAERFVPDPFAGIAGARMYRTGDDARYLPTGDIDCLGRRDRQVKVRGFRIELEEIEGALRCQPGVHEALVIVREDVPGDKRLVAYVVADGAADLGKELRAALARSLPAYMIPSVIVRLDALPLTPNGKVDRAALPAAGAEHAATATGDRPHDMLEMQLTLIWERVFRVRPIGIDDDFFDLGGHSLLAATVLAEIAKTYGRPLPLVTLFRAPTIASLARLLREGGPPMTALVALQPNGSNPPLVLLHNAGGHLLRYRPLLSCLDPSIPVYGIQAPGHER
ncbi:MAG TPA: amino acid adenylation domain-containing protein, partial [Gemmatimonadaceae bacterium]